ncbi:MAG: hypothetical protein EBS61_13075 [Betaproteobacteria bacterium]|nr:hypothetical protein [Betaproteobacteria bacterium]
MINRFFVRAASTISHGSKHGCQIVSALKHPSRGFFQSQPASFIALVLRMAALQDFKAAESWLMAARC